MFQTNNFFQRLSFQQKKMSELLTKLSEKKILRFCLRLNFFLKYIPQLYFICNHLITLIGEIRTFGKIL